MDKHDKKWMIEALNTLGLPMLVLNELKDSEIQRLWDVLNKFFGDDKYLATLESKFVETCYEAAHSLYAGTMEDIQKEIYMGSFKKPNDPKFFIMDEIECFDIDWPWQFEIAEKLYLNG